MYKINGKSIEIICGDEDFKKKYHCNNCEDCCFCEVKEFDYKSKKEKVYSFMGSWLHERYIELYIKEHSIDS